MGNNIGTKKYQGEQHWGQMSTKENNIGNFIGGNNTKENNIGNLIGNIYWGGVSLVLLAGPS